MELKKCRVSEKTNQLFNYVINKSDQKFKPYIKGNINFKIHNRESPKSVDTIESPKSLDNKDTNVEDLICDQENASPKQIVDGTPDVNGNKACIFDKKSGNVNTRICDHEISTINEICTRVLIIA